MRFFRISIEPPAIIQPRHLRKHYSTSVSSRVAHAAHDLHGLGCRCRSRPDCRTLSRSRCLRPTGMPSIGVHRCAIEQQLPGVELDFHVSEFPLQTLKLAQARGRTACAAVAHWRACLVSIAAERERTRGVADALDIEAGDLLLEAAFLQQHVLGPHVDIVEIGRSPILRRSGSSKACPASHRRPRAGSAPSRCRRRPDRSARRRASRRRTGHASEYFLAVMR